MQLRSLLETKLITAVLATVMITMTYFLWHPGAMSFDTFAQLSQARSGIFSDGWPPLFSLLWGHLDGVLPGPAPVLALQLTLYFGSAAVIIASISSRMPVTAGAAYLTFALWPPIHGIIGAIWIDILMASVFLGSCAMIVIAKGCEGARRNAAISVSIVLLVVGIGFRHNAAAAAGPIAVLIALVATRRTKLTLNALAFGLGGGMVIVILGFAATSHISSYLVNNKSHFWTGLVQYDLAGIAVREPNTAFSRQIFEPQTLDDVVTLYTPRSSIPLKLGYQVHELEQGKTAAQATPLSDRFTSGTTRDRTELRDAFLAAVISEPTAYLAHRTAVFSSLIGLEPWNQLWGAVYTRIDSNNENVPPRPELENSLFSTLRNLMDSYIFRPFTYLIASVLGLAASGVAYYNSRSDKILISSALYLSGLLHMLGLFFVAQSADFRYSHWLITTTMLATVILALQLRVSTDDDECEDPSFVH
ncbi:MAG: hypothetical protein ACK4UW_19120 [Rhizobium rhizophilum]|uniref:hypothetical protein n=1 Tax=Rhizobium rhizophilum TaxID=1850373 RepID=UPI00391A2190